MKKRELIDYLKAQNIVNKNQKLLAHMKYRDKFNWFPKIDDLEDEFNILKKEVNRRYNECNEALKIYNKFRRNCKHEVRIHDYIYGLPPVWKEKVSFCIFCDKKISENSHTIWDESVNINNRFVSFLDKYTSIDEDGMGHYERFVRKNGYSKNDIFHLIEKIYNDKNDDDDIDLIEAFSKLNLPDCEIVNKKLKPEYYVLIIGGYNTEKIFDNIKVCDTSKVLNYFNRDCTYFFDFYKYFSSLLNTKIHLVYNDLIKIDDTNSYLSTYRDIEQLQIRLEQAASSYIHYDLILDLSNLHTFSLINNQIYSSNYVLDLRKYFPDSSIFKINLIFGSYSNDIVLLNDDGNNVSNGFDESCKMLRKALKKK